MKSSTHVVHGGAVHFRDDFRSVHSYIIASSTRQGWSIWADSLSWAAPALFTAAPHLATKPVATSNDRGVSG